MKWSKSVSMDWNTYNCEKLCFEPSDWMKIERAVNSESFS